MVFFLLILAILLALRKRVTRKMENQLVNNYLDKQEAKEHNQERETLIASEQTALAATEIKEEVQ